MNIGGHEIETKNEDKVLFPARGGGEGATKGDLIAYHERIAPTLLPHLADRPLSLQRFPDGVEAGGFYQKDAPDHFPDWIRTARLEKEGGTVDHVVCDDAATLVYLANQAVVTLHAFPSRVDRPHHPDRLVFDFDPPEDDDGGFAVVKDAARALAELLDDAGLTPYVQTTGSKGLHVVAPLDREAPFDAARAFARDVAERLVDGDPERLTTAQRKDRRGGRVFVDVLRNAYAQTMVAPYSVRPRPGAPVATPLSWPELSSGDLRPDGWTIRDIFRRLGQKDDPWAEMDRHAASLSRARERLR